jgi:hypothetical protein
MVSYNSYNYKFNFKNANNDIIKTNTHTNNSIIECIDSFYNELDTR